MKSSKREDPVNSGYDRRSFFQKTSLVLGSACIGASAAQAVSKQKEKGMIQGELQNWKTIAGLEGLEEAFLFLEKPETKELTEGKHLLHGDDMFATVAYPTTEPPEKRRYEAHQKYIDVQFLFEGSEAIRVTPVQSLVVSTPFDAQKDIAFYLHTPHFDTVVLRPGRFAVFFPEDAHMPLCRQDEIQKLHKVVVKISVDYYKKKLAQK